MGSMDLGRKLVGTMTRMNITLKRFVAASSMLAAGCFMASCTKGTNDVKSASQGSSFRATPTDLRTSYPPGAAIADPIKFVVTTKEGRPVPSIDVEFKAFDITLADKAALSESQIKAELLAKWNNSEFTMGTEASFAKDLVLLDLVVRHVPETFQVDLASRTKTAKPALEFAPQTIHHPSSPLPCGCLRIQRLQILCNLFAFALHPTTTSKIVVSRQSKITFW